MALDLGKQIGPLPAGAWIAVIGTGIGIAVWARGSGSGDAAPVDESGGVGTGVDGQWVDVSPPEDLPPDDAPPMDNEEWGRRAINWLIHQKYDAALSQSAITKALTGEKRMGIREYALWRRALQHFGAPPVSVIVLPPIPGPRPPAPQPPPRDPPPRHVRWYLTKPGDTLKMLARRFYHDESKWHRIYEANRKGVMRPDLTRGWIEHPDHRLTPGRRLYIPNG